MFKVNKTAQKHDWLSWETVNSVIGSNKMDSGFLIDKYFTEEFFKKILSSLWFDDYLSVMTNKSVTTEASWLAGMEETELGLAPVRRIFSQIQRFGEKNRRAPSLLPLTF